MSVSARLDVQFMFALFAFSATFCRRHKFAFSSVISKFEFLDLRNYLVYGGETNGRDRNIEPVKSFQLILLIITILLFLHICSVASVCSVSSAFATQVQYSVYENAYADGVRRLLNR